MNEIQYCTWVSILRVTFVVCVSAAETDQEELKITDKTTWNALLQGTVKIQEDSVKWTQKYMEDRTEV